MYKTSSRYIRQAHLLLSLKISKLLHKGAFWGEACWFQKVEQAKQFLHCVLERRARQQDLVLLDEDKGMGRVSSTKAHLQKALLHQTICNDWINDYHFKSLTSYDLCLIR